MEDTRMVPDEERPALGQQLSAGANQEEMCMQEFKKKLEKVMKISPEAFYRICDIEYQQTVTTSDFKKEVDKHDLGISEQNINRLITIFDEDHEGNITL